MITLLHCGPHSPQRLVNAFAAIDVPVQLATSADDIRTAEQLVLSSEAPFDATIRQLLCRNLLTALRDYLFDKRSFLGIGTGAHILFDTREHAPAWTGLGVFPGTVRPLYADRPTHPFMGWAGIRAQANSRLFHGLAGDEKFFFAHVDQAVPARDNLCLAQTDTASPVPAVVGDDTRLGVQFLPHKSGSAGLHILKNYADTALAAPQSNPAHTSQSAATPARSIVACLDMHADTHGNLVVTKGDQYDVNVGGTVRNLGDPVEMACHYYDDGADEIAFLHIAGYRDNPLRNTAVTDIISAASRRIFVPLTIGGGIRDYTDDRGLPVSALEIAARYFRAGADKISIGSNAVDIAKRYLHTGRKTGGSAIETISQCYGAHTVVVSVDPRRVYVNAPSDVPHHVVPSDPPGPAGEAFCWYECMVKGGREGTGIDAITLAQAVEALGAGTILLNSIDKDGTNSGFDLALINAVREAVTIPVVASSGAGKVAHFSEVFAQTRAESALAAGILHRREVSIRDIKQHLHGKVEVRK
ncbi:MAG: HisA/HisF-related TIM barrel protein [Proteobacteria bacterium]|nr:HisA/HisF-related TIM barrel protein [Pseudomonadota bacterium]